MLRTAGTNCDAETSFAFELCGAEVEAVHVNQLIRGQKDFFNFQILAIPGGFSYGDDVEAGKILANELIYRVGKPLKEYVAAGRLVLGICNGFQVLVKMGLLPGIDNRIDRVTLTFNDSGKFEDRWVHLENVKSSKSVFTRDLKPTIFLPVAHGEGKFYSRSAKVIKNLEKNHQIVFRYVDNNGREAGYPANPNGSVNNIAGICNPEGNVLGMMPHPERYVTRYNHPSWTRHKLPEEGDGLAIFRNAVHYAREKFL